MRQLIILLLALTCSTAICQQNKKHLKSSKSNFRISLGLSGTISSSASDMKNHLKSAGLGDKVNGTYDYISSGGNDFYPQSEVYMMGFELMAERRIGKQAWLGISIGSDKMEKVTGYDRFGTKSSFWAGTYSIGQFVTLTHSSWFLSSQFSIATPDGRLEFFGGPTATFHKVGTTWNYPRIKKEGQTTLGAHLGVKVNFTDHWNMFLTYRITGKVQHESSSQDYTNDGELYTSILPAKEFSYNHLRVGLSYRFSISK